MENFQLESSIVEKKSYCKATTDEDFADNRVLIVLNKAASMKFKTYTTKDFAGINVSSVRETTKSTADIVQQQQQAEKTGVMSVELKDRADNNMLIETKEFKQY